MKNNLPIRIVKVGSDSYPATEEDLQAVQNELAAVANDPDVTLTSVYAYDLEQEPSVRQGVVSNRRTVRGVVRSASTR